VTDATPASDADLAAQAEQIHALLRMAPGSSPAHRALHAKGVVAGGHFTASGALDGLTTASHLVDGTTDALARFSHPGGDPAVSDAIPSGRGLAVKLSTPAGSHQLVTVSSPAFLVRDGGAFIELILARAPDPETGAPDPARIGAFLEAHPEALPAIQYALTTPAPHSYGDLTYNSLNSFVLVAPDGTRRPFRYSFTPAGPAHSATPADGTELAPDHLADELAARLAADSIAFDLVVFLATDDDPIDDATAIWPERKGIVAGTLVLDRLVPDADPVIFDPTNVVAGVELSADPILQLRRLVYGLSYAQRTS